MELRHDAYRNESSDRHHWRRKPLSDEVIHDVRDVYEFKNEATKADESKCGGRDEMEENACAFVD